MDATGLRAATWPAPADAGAAERLLERFGSQGPAEARLLRQPGRRGDAAGPGWQQPLFVGPGDP